MRELSFFFFLLTFMTTRAADAEEIKLRCTAGSSSGGSVVDLVSINTATKTIRSVQIDTIPNLGLKRVEQEFKDGAFGAFVRSVSLKPSDASHTSETAAFEQRLKAQMTALKARQHVAIDEDKFAAGLEKDGKSFDAFAIDRSSGDFMVNGKAVMKCIKDEKKF